MIIHKQGLKIILLFFILLLTVNYSVSHFLSEKKTLNIVINSFSVLLFTLIVVFFRNPKRTVKENDVFVFSPADGKIVALEKVQEEEHFNDQRIQISIFMSIFNVHKNWIPVSGEISYDKYHKGKYFMANLPKSSIFNERNTIVIKTKKNEEILVRQIAGFIARRIVCNVKTNDVVHQDQELGFIKFGSRLDVFLPINSIVKVNIGDKVVGSLTVLADLSNETI